MLRGIAVSYHYTFHNRLHCISKRPCLTSKRYMHKAHKAADGCDLNRFLTCVASGRRSSLYGGSRNTLAIDSNGQLWSWGWNDRGTLGHGHRAAEHKPKRVQALEGRNIVQVHYDSS